MLGVLGSGMALVAMGVAAGLAASLAVAGLLKSLLFGVSGHDAATYGIAVALLVCAVPPSTCHSAFDGSASVPSGTSTTLSEPNSLENQTGAAQASENANALVGIA